MRVTRVTFNTRAFSIFFRIMRSLDYSYHRKRFKDWVSCWREWQICWYASMLSWENNFPSMFPSSIACSFARLVTHFFLHTTSNVWTNNAKFTRNVFSFKQTNFIFKANTFHLKTKWKLFFVIKRLLLKFNHFLGWVFSKVLNWIFIVKHFTSSTESLWQLRWEKLQMMWAKGFIARRCESFCNSSTEQIIVWVEISSKI